MAPESAREECFAEKTKKYSNFEKEVKPAANGTNGTSNATKEGALLAFRSVNATYALSHASDAASRHYRCFQICSVRYTSEDNSRCISECETEMYTCQSRAPQTAIKDCENKVQVKYETDESKTETAGNATNETKK